MTDIQTNVSVQFNVPSKSDLPPTQENISSSERPPRTRSRRRSWWSNRPAPSLNKYFGTQEPAYKPFDFVIKPKEEPVRVVCLMGLEQVWQCILIEYQDDMIIVDAGMEFASGDATLGADYIIPDVSYIKKNIKKLRWIILTHGHLDHIGALKHLLPDLGRPTIYTTPLTLGIVKKTFDDKKDLIKIKHHLVNPETEILKLWCFTIEFAEVNHNIPETYALAIHTPKGVIFTSADFKFDYTPAIGKPSDLSKIARIWSEWVKLYIWDSLNSWKQGYVPSEKEIGKTLDDAIRMAGGRILIATFATNVWRIIQIIKSAVKHNKIVFLSGRSMVNNVEICQELGYINVPKHMIRKLDKTADEMPDQKVVILCTGAQGEEFSALARMSRGEHQQITLRRGDTILLSSSTIPGNELAMASMKNNLVSKDIKLITNDSMDIHTSGHGGAEDHKLMLTLLKPQFFLPFFLDATARYAHRDLAINMGFDPSKILMPNETGSIIELFDNGVRVAEKKLPLRTVLVDGKWIGHLSGECVIKARQQMSKGWVVAFLLKIDSESKTLVGNVQLESRWFVYSSEVKKIHTDIVTFIAKTYDQLLNKKMSIREILRKLKDDLTKHIEGLIGREPIVIPMFLYVTKDAFNFDAQTSNDDSIIGMTLEEQGYGAD